MAKQIAITWIKSSIGYPDTQRRTIKSLGLSKLNQTVIKEDSAQLRGQINKVQHLLSVVELD
ncbi:MAG: 50S ribosomal protein L30 [Syntrophomonadaceae bacterium]|nr:50S ribosomal protein L30 [Syntrophomonadaceae bacterium]